MIRINLSPEAQWLDLGHGVRLQLLPLTTALMVATRSDPAVQALDAEASNDTRAAVFAAALARRAVVDWEGVGDADGNVLPASPEGIDALLSLWPIFEAFNLLYVSRGMAHSKLGCDKSPILLESKENERWPTQSWICVNDAQSKTC